MAKRIDIGTKGKLSRGFRITSEEEIGHINFTSNNGALTYSIRAFKASTPDHSFVLKRFFSNQNSNMFKEMFTCYSNYSGLWNDVQNKIKRLLRLGYTVDGMPTIPPEHS